MKRIKGFSFVEIIIAVTIFIGLITAIMTVMPNAYKSINNGKDRRLALQLAKKELEFVSQLDFDDQDTSNAVLQNRTNTLTTTYEGSTTKKVFTTVYNISSYSADPDNLKVVQVQIQWDAGQLNTTPNYRHVELEMLTYNKE